MKQIMAGIMILLLASLVGFSSTAYTDNKNEKLNTKVQINKSKIEMIYDSLNRMEAKIDIIRNNI